MIHGVIIAIGSAHKTGMFKYIKAVDFIHQYRLVMSANPKKEARLIVWLYFIVKLL